MTARNITSLFFLLLLIAVMTIVMGPGFATDTQKKLSPLYNLSVSFDLQISSIHGAAEIIFSDLTEIVLSIGDLAIMSADLNSTTVECNKLFALYLHERP